MGPFLVHFNIAHHLGSHPKVFGYAKRQNLMIHFSDVHAAVVTEMSPGRGDCRAGERVIEDFVTRPGQLADRVSTHHAVSVDVDDQFIVGKTRLIGRNDRRGGDCTYRIFQHHAGTIVWCSLAVCIRGSRGKTMVSKTNVNKVRIPYPVKAESKSPDLCYRVSQQQYGSPQPRRPSRGEPGIPRHCQREQVAMLRDRI